jgi:XTP/dITP diphosphohydrolase
VEQSPINAKVILTMKNRLIFATANKHKLSEIRAILPNHEVLGLADVDIHDDIPETGKTLEENAAIKVQFLYNILQSGVLSEDTGLEVVALNGAPGVHTARYAGEDRDPLKNMQKLLSELANHTDRSARFRTVIAYINDLGERLYFEGIVNGRIAEAISGTEGFGYDPVFIPEGFDRTFAELPNEIKNAISHRARAVNALVEYLSQGNI